MRFCSIDIARSLVPRRRRCERIRPYFCTECGKEHAKDGLYKPGHDDDKAMCAACFDHRPVVEFAKEGVATLRDKRTGVRWQILARAVKAH